MANTEDEFSVRDRILDGSDSLILGHGNHLAFVLAVVESLKTSHADDFITGYGRPPTVIMLLPTRELAKEVFRDFESYGRSDGLAACLAYGGAPYDAEKMKLIRGVDIVVGTPSRIRKHIEAENLHLRTLKFFILYEANDLPSLGFRHDVHFILDKIRGLTKVQTLFSSKISTNWVKSISKRFLKSHNVRHILHPCLASCSTAARTDIIRDIIYTYNSGGRSVVFTEMTDTAIELSKILISARILDGRLPLPYRNILQDFKSGNFSTLVITDVSLQEPDHIHPFIKDVQCVVHCEVPHNITDYIRRSGHMSDPKSSGNARVSIMLSDLEEQQQQQLISEMKNGFGVQFEHLPAQPVHAAKIASCAAAKLITEVPERRHHHKSVGIMAQLPRARATEGR